MSDTAKKHQSIRLFKNPILEALTHVHPSLPFIIWIPVVSYLMYTTIAETELGWVNIGFYFLTGLLFWTLTEYGMHRYVFHHQAKTPVGKYLVFLFHGIHHDDPQDPSRLVMPPVISLTLGPAFYFLFLMAFGPVNGVPFFSGFMVGYLVYDYIHFAVHHFRPRTAWGHTRKDHHMKHHFMADKAKWGVSSSLWDRIFKTFG